MRTLLKIHELLFAVILPTVLFWFLDAYYLHQERNTGIFMMLLRAGIRYGGGVSTKAFSMMPVNTGKVPDNI